MNKHKAEPGFLIIGFSSLSVILLVLCMASFAASSVSIAKSDDAFSRRLADYKTAYYKACTAAETITASIDQTLSETAAKTAVPSSAEAFADSAYAKAAAAALDSSRIEGTALTCAQSKDGLSVSFQIPFADTQALHVILRILDYTSHETYYEIQSWQAVSTNDWEGYEKLDLMPIGG